MDTSPHGAFFIAVSHVADLVAFRRIASAMVLGCRPCGGRNKARNPLLTSRALAARVVICAPTQRTFWPDIVKFHLLEAHNGSNEFQIARLLIDSEVSPRLLKRTALEPSVRSKQIM